MWRTILNTTSNNIAIPVALEMGVMVGVSFSTNWMNGGGVPFGFTLIQSWPLVAPSPGNHTSPSSTIPSKTSRTMLLAENLDFVNGLIVNPIGPEPPEFAVATGSKRASP